MKFGRAPTTRNTSAMRRRSPRVSQNWVEVTRAGDRCRRSGTVAGGALHVAEREPCRPVARAAVRGLASGTHGLTAAAVAEQEDRADDQRFDGPRVQISRERQGIECLPR